MATTVERSTRLAAPAATVWQAAQTVDAFRYVTRGLITVTGLRGRSGSWSVGESLVTWVLLFGFVPFARYRLELVDLDDATMTLRTEEGGGVVRSWQHTITVAPLHEDGGAGCRYTDRIEIDAGPLTGPVAAYARVFFALRQRRWRRLAVRLPRQ